jgi:hypothetical protein
MRIKKCKQKVQSTTTGQDEMDHSDYRITKQQGMNEVFQQII